MMVSLAGTWQEVEVLRTPSVVFETMEEPPEVNYKLTSSTIRRWRMQILLCSNQASRRNINRSEMLLQGGNVRELVHCLF
jgi:hypothetical protein